MQEGPPYGENRDAGNTEVSADGVQKEADRLLGLRTSPSGNEDPGMRHGQGTLEAGRVAETRETKEQQTWLEAWQEFNDDFDERVREMRSIIDTSLRNEYGQEMDILKSASAAIARAEGLRARGEVSLAEVRNNEDLGDALKEFYKDYTTLWDRDAIRATAVEQEKLRSGAGADMFENFPESAEGEASVTSALIERYHKMPEWLTQGITSLRYVDTPESGAHHEDRRLRHGESGASELVIYGVSGKTTPEEVMALVSRELAHRNDWDNAPTLSVSERTMFLQEVTALKNEMTATEAEFERGEQRAQVDTKERAREAKAYWQTLNEKYDEDPDLLKDKEKDLVMRWRNNILLSHAEKEAATAMEQRVESSESRV